MRTVLIVEDEKAIRAGLLAMVAAAPVKVETALACRNGVEALDILQSRAVDIMITDIRMPKMDGIELVRRAGALPSPPLILVVSGYSDFDYAVDVFRHGVRDYLLKPIERERLFALLVSLEDELCAVRLEKKKSCAMERLAGLLAEDPESIPLRKIQDAVLFAEAYFRSDINMAVASNHVSMNYSQFSALFKAYTGSSFPDHLRNLRLIESRRLLAETSLSLSRVAEMSGFKDEKHFSKRFKQEIGVSPGDFRRGLRAIPSPWLIAPM